MHPAVLAETPSAGEAAAVAISPEAQEQEVAQLTQRLQDLQAENPEASAEAQRRALKAYRKLVQEVCDFPSGKDVSFANAFWDIVIGSAQGDEEADAASAELERKKEEVALRAMQLELKQLKKQLEERNSAKVAAAVSQLRQQEERSSARLEVAMAQLQRESAEHRAQLEVKQKEYLEAQGFGDAKAAKLHLQKLQKDVQQRLPVKLHCTVGHRPGRGGAGHWCRADTLHLSMDALQTLGDVKAKILEKCKRAEGLTLEQVTLYKGLNYRGLLPQDNQKSLKSIGFNHGTEHSMCVDLLWPN